MPEKRECREVWYEGRVQGVGFRYQTLQVARGFTVTGYVENLDDGRVHLVAEGLSREIEDFLTTVASELEGYIRATEQRALPVTGSYRSFAIRS